MAQQAHHTDFPNRSNGVAAPACVTSDAEGRPVSAEKRADANNRITGMRDTSPMSTWANIDVTVVYANWF